MPQKEQLIAELSDLLGPRNVFNGCNRALSIRVRCRTLF